VREHQLLYQKDPVINWDLRRVVLQKLNESAAVNGQSFQQIIQTVDPLILSQLQSPPTPPKPTNELKTAQK